MHDLTINTLTRKVTRAGKKINLQPREFSLLEYLMRNSGRVVTKSMIIEHVWDYNFDPHTNVVEARVCRLRDKIDKEFDTALILTIRGAGYVLNHFHAEEQKELPFLIDAAAAAVRVFVTDGLEAAMNRYNGSQLEE